MKWRGDSGRSSGRLQQRPSRACRRSSLTVHRGCSRARVSEAGTGRGPRMVLIISEACSGGIMASPYPSPGISVRTVLFCFNHGFIIACVWADCCY